jgi:hypothetical protein
MKAVAFITLVGLSFCIWCDVVRAQERWRTSKSPERNFTVEAPAPLREVASFDGEHGANLSPDQKYAWATCYAVIEPGREDARFGVNIVNGHLKDIRSQPRAKLLWYLSAVLIGDDDAPNPKIQKSITVNGLRGNEYFHIRDENAGGGNQSPLYTRGRIFDSGDRIYVVTFIGQNQKDLTSADAERFLNSFRLVKHRTRARQRRA